MSRFTHGIVPSAITNGTVLGKVYAWLILYFWHLEILNVKEKSAFYSSLSPANHAAGLYLVS